MATLIMGESKVIKDTLKMIERVAKARTNILVIGESGTGKELVAKRIHEVSTDRTKPFVPVNCGAIPENLIESELFGHKKGSFTGAVSDKMGLFEAAHLGTLFLDEVGELPLPLQVKLLRAIQEKQIRRVGDTKTISIDVRIIAATNRDLELATKNGGFREDLYYRLNVIMIKTPPLRDRGDDIHLLADFFLKKYNARTGKSLKGFDPAVRRAFEAHGWPGNVRELENVIERSGTLESEDRITLAGLTQKLRELGETKDGPEVVEAKGVKDLPLEKGKGIFLPAPDFESGPVDLDQILADVEKKYLASALKHAGGVKKRAADLLGMTFRSIRYRLEKLGMDED